MMMTTNGEEAEIETAGTATEETTAGVGVRVGDSATGTGATETGLAESDETSADEYQQGVGRFQPWYIVYIP